MFGFYSHKLVSVALHRFEEIAHQMKGLDELSQNYNLYWEPTDLKNYN